MIISIVIYLYRKAVASLGIRKIIFTTFDSPSKTHNLFSDTILELEEAFKVLIIRNKVLSALLKKCGGTAPPFTEPKIFNYIVTNPLDENDLNELYVKQNGRPPKNAKARTKKKLQTLHDDEEVLQKKKKIKSNVSEGQM